MGINEEKLPSLKNLISPLDTEEGAYTTSPLCQSALDWNYYYSQVSGKIMLKYRGIIIGYLFLFLNLYCTEQIEQMLFHAYNLLMQSNARSWNIGSLWKKDKIIIS